jgi:hypothetical protein
MINRTKAMFLIADLQPQPERWSVIFGVFGKLAERVSYCLEVVSPDDIDAVEIVHPVEYVSESVFDLEESLVGGSERLPQSIAVVAVEVVELGLDGSYLVVHEVYVRRLTTHLRTYTAGQSVKLVLVVACNIFFFI